MKSILVDHVFEHTGSHFNHKMMANMFLRIKKLRRYIKRIEKDIKIVKRHRQRSASPMVYTLQIAIGRSTIDYIKTEIRNIKAWVRA